ncbi:hypothetical protein QKW60_05730 [Defluviimonas aestuarii]|uniref:hypothetical protein n=1 Tax=Albidovulum aestuarii TaxID=1130726 RepID=UPI00249C45B6|nr:hypothetical protein [Defluviimonas aestuarii]MDI3335897.1 hypothetical protein [Defluviimonas aestuarii]
MFDRPIIFSAPMVRALLDGRKTQTRRIVKDRGALPEFCGGRYDNKNDPTNYGWQDYERGEWITLDMFRRYRFVPYAPGDRLWVKEAWRTWVNFDHLKPREIATGPSQGLIGYPADSVRTGHGRLRSPIHMPRWASRLTLLVTDVRVQRLQEISEDDARAEGGDAVTMEDAPRAASWSRRQDFSRLWNSIHGPDAWDANPWVAAISFTVHRGNIDQMEAGDD